MECFSPHRRLRNIGDFSTFPAYAGVFPYDRQSRLRAVLFFDAEAVADALCSHSLTSVRIEALMVCFLLEHRNSIRFCQIYNNERFANEQGG